MLKRESNWLRTWFCLHKLTTSRTLSFPLRLQRLQATMVSRIKIGKLVQKYMRVEPVPGKTLGNTRSMKGCSGRMSSVVSRSSSRERSLGNSDCDYWDEDPPADVPEGCLAVYVGPEMRRFVIQTGFLYKRVFRELLSKSEEEYGFETAGGLRIACEADLFEKLLWQLEAEWNSFTQKMQQSIDRSFNVQVNMTSVIAFSKFQKRDRVKPLRQPTRADQQQTSFKQLL